MEKGYHYQFPAWNHSPFPYQQRKIWH
jgi:hypothetical protein